MENEYTQSETPEIISGRFEKILKILMALAIVVLAGEFVWFLGVSPFRPLERIGVTGFDRISREEIIAMAGFNPGTSYFSVNPEAIERSLMSFGIFETARVHKHFPDKVEIILEGRRAAASAFSQVNGVTIPVLVDSQGVIFGIGYGGASLPVISGITIENPFPGMQLPRLLVPLFEELERIEISSPELLGAVSEIRINRTSGDAFDLLLFPIHGRIPVRLSELNAETLAYAFLMLDVLSSKGGIESLDFRSGIASYIMREGSFE